VLGGLLKEVSEFLVRSLGEQGLGPQVRGEVRVGVTDGSEGSLDKVTEGTGGTAGGSVTVGDTGKSEELLGGRGSDDTGTTGSRDQTSEDGTALSGDLARNGVGFTEVGSPVTTTNRDDGELGEDDGTTDGGGNFLGALDTETDVTVRVTNDDESLETGTLSSTGLFLDRHDLHHLVLKVRQEVVDDLVFLDGEREKVNLFDGLDLAVLHETTELGARNPFLLFVLTSASTSTAATSSTSATSAASESTTSTATIGRCCIGHLICCCGLKS